MTISELNEHDCFARTTGIVLQADGCTATITVEERHLNGADVCQGGVLFYSGGFGGCGFDTG